MNEYLPVIIMMNNYFHDVATALLAASAFVLLGINKLTGSDNRSHKKIFHYLTRVALVSLVWIIVGGVPRVMFFKKYEWWDAASKGIIPALIVKHIVMFFLVGYGLFLWVRIRKQMRIEKK